MKGIIGRKIGMTSMFLNSGKQVPVTMIQVKDNVVTKILERNKHGYDALQIAGFKKREKSTNKPLKGHFKKAQTTPMQVVKELRGMSGYKLGEKINLSLFATGELVDVTGISKGKGFAGAIKRWNQRILPMTHGGGGGSQPRRLTGSSGPMAPKRVLKGKNMPGHLGHEKVTVQNLEIINIDQENKLLVVKGAIPGPKKGFVLIKNNAKSLGNREAAQLIDLHEMHLKNDLLENAKRYGANVNTEMSIEDMTNAVNKARMAKEAGELVEEIENNLLNSKNHLKSLEDKLPIVKEEMQKVSENEEENKTRKEQLENLQNQIESAKDEIAVLKKQHVDAKADLVKKEADAKAVQIEVETFEDSTEKEGK